MSVLAAGQGQSVAVRLRGLEVLVEVDLDTRELELRKREGLSVAGLDHAQLAALLTVPRLEHALLAALPPATQMLVRKRGDLVEQSHDGQVTRRVGPPLWVEMVTLPVNEWRNGLRAIGRFAPYSARRLQLPHVPADVDDLCVEATYWGVGVRIECSRETEDLVTPEPFVPGRYTGASWAFAEQTLSAFRECSSGQFRS